jgi:hypothetical protein
VVLKWDPIYDYTLNDHVCVKFKSYGYLDFLNHVKKEALRAKKNIFNYNNNKEISSNYC